MARGKTWEVRLLLPFLWLAALPTSPALAQNPVLRPVTLSAACQRAGYRVWTDAQERPRVLRYRLNVPDNSRSLAQYYDERGRLLTLRASFSGFAGPVYDLTARLDGKGNILSETGFRRKGDRTNLTSLILDLKGVLAGKCPS